MPEARTQTQSYINTHSRHLVFQRSHTYIHKHNDSNTATDSHTHILTLRVIHSQAHGHRFTHAHTLRAIHSHTHKDSQPYTQT